MRVCILPYYRGPDRADGGIRRVIEAQQRWLPSFGIDLVDGIDGADLVATHAMEHPPVPVGTPWVHHNHGLYFQDFGWQAEWYQKANRQLVDVLRAADHVTAPSEWVAQALRRGMWLRPTVLHHGVNPEEWEGGESEGYILWNKARQDVASDPAAVNELALRDPSLRFVSTFGNATPNVKITGALPYPEAQAMVRAAGLYLCTARETFGIGTLEAMAAGVPVVGWAWGGQRDIIRHGETGWLAKPGDYDGLLEGIRWSLANRKRVGEAARADVRDRWTWERAIGRYAELYRQLVAGELAQREAPKVSVIVPCYNLGRFVGETLQSVQAQTMTDWECIVVDDASTDDSGEVVRPFTQTDSRITYLRNERNRHVSETRNRGLATSRGRYVVCLDADDRITPETLALLSVALDKDRGIALAYGGLQIMSEAGVLRPQAHDWPPDFDFKEQIQGRNQVPTLCMMRRSVIDRTGGYRRRVTPVEDADLWTRAASAGMVPRKVTDAPTLLYRLRADSISRTMPNPKWSDWYPWSRQRALVPFGAPVDPPAGVSALPVPSCEPVLISVIIPVGRGHERLLVDALDSVEAQTFRQWECIVVNDTGAPLPWTPSWATVLTTERAGSGPAAARNLGLRASKGALFVPLDADDYLQPDALQVLYQTWQDTGGVVYSAWWDDFGDGQPRKVYQPPAYDAKLLTLKGCIHAVTALYPKSTWVDAGGFDEKMTNWEDWDFQLALASKGVCGTKIDAPLWTYRKATGRRREENQAQFERGKRAILSKWGRFWDGRETLMACSSCPGGGGKKSYGSANGGSMALLGGGPDGGTAPEGAMLLEFLGPSPSVATYRGRVSGTQYRFGNNESHKVKYVLAADAPHLLSLKGMFRSLAIPAPSAAAAAGVVTAPVLDAITPAFLEPLEPQFTISDSVPDANNVKPEYAYDVIGVSYRELRDLVPKLTAKDLKSALAAEEAQETPRTSVVTLLQAALNKLAVPA
jgi:glycosyltransferase involved in cell wall biosynthesis